MAELPAYYKIHTDGLTVELEPIYEELSPVVRCKECKHRDWRQSPEHGRVETICKHPCGLKHPRKDKFCSYGERRNDESQRIHREIPERD